ncbi:MAG: globin family protein [Pirellulales bacterium]
MSLQVTLLEESFAAVAPQGQQLVDAFYRNLFADYPEAEPMFASVNIGEQKKKLLASLQLVIANLRKSEVLVDVLHKMGERHVEYGTLESHYPAVGAALLKSLAEVAGDQWNDQLQTAWAEAYDAIAGLMMEGAAVPVPG